ncbi:hypothetical protein MJT46_017344 [Ovis ammon polii x Ovis aries]|nr:hypothetical protein MJT46_017344 [Ovis ammon polii x Ovis aries]
MTCAEQAVTGAVTSIVSGASQPSTSGEGWLLLRLSLSRALGAIILRDFKLKTRSKLNSSAQASRSHVIKAIWLHTHYLPPPLPWSQPHTRVMKVAERAHGEEDTVEWLSVVDQSGCGEPLSRSVGREDPRTLKNKERNQFQMAPPSKYEISGKSATGCQKLIEVDDERKPRTFYEKHMATEAAADALGEEWKGYVVRISGGNDKQGFPMKQGVLTHGRVLLLLSKGHSCYRPRRTGERKRKSVRGCIVDANLSVLNLVIVKKGEKDIPGLTVPRRLGPKRASRIRKLFNLSKEDDVHQYVVRKPLNKDGKKPRTKAPKIQRLVTPRVLQHKRRRIALKKQRTKKNKEEAAEYAELLAKRMKEAEEKRQEQIAKRRRLSSLRASTSKSESSQK